MGYMCELCQFYDFSEKYFIKNSYSIIVSGDIVATAAFAAVVFTFRHMEGSVAHNFGGFGPLVAGFAHLAPSVATTCRNGFFGAKNIVLTKLMMPSS